MNESILLWGLLFGSIGVGYFMYGRRRNNVVIRFTGIALMFYPYLFQSSWSIVLIGIALMFVPKFVKL